MQARLRAYSHEVKVGGKANKIKRNVNKYQRTRMHFIRMCIARFSGNFYWRGYLHLGKIRYKYITLPQISFADGNNRLKIIAFARCECALKPCSHSQSLQCIESEHTILPSSDGNWSLLAGKYCLVVGISTEN